ncbi:MAG TPA: hypothetical protein PL190_06305 [Caldisericia bacterium]|nr:hypothetical protein [Caldisericia bacterium]HOG70886.1 hypothetical protein [Caldisericia bacterium]HPA66117.1 hypothetical protein [Caldisericia bacterium]HPM44276.1 hypothetical protein [Caldisericia bacterium]HQL69009.1 hypothetical protein [Caldisericia bacterium]
MPLLSRTLGLGLWPSSGGMLEQDWIFVELACLIGEIRNKGARLSERSTRVEEQGGHAGKGNHNN